jgi:hypothetical protein
MSLLLPLLLLFQLPGSSPEKICELTAIKFANAFVEWKWKATSGAANSPPTIHS